VLFLNKLATSESRSGKIAIFLFFAIAVSSLLGVTQTLSGSYVGASNPYLYGLSFYTASLAYHFKIKHNISLSDLFKISNPLLLATGPVALFVRSIRHNSFKRRLNYYLPFVLVGVFYYQIIGSPLTELFYLITEVDLVSSLCFAIIFELFVYANFCGLSLIIFGVFGIFGYRVPLNFKQPFSSSNVVEFWRGWHLSLSMVLKVLFYAPARKKHSVYVAITTVYLASALWHGITLNFLLWGCFHAIIFSVSVYSLKQGFKTFPFVLLPIGIVLGRLIFADTDTDRLMEKLLFSFDGFAVFDSIMSARNTTKVSLLIGFIMIFIEFAFQKHSLVSKRNYKFLRIPAALVCICSISILFVSSGGIDFAVYGQR
tara:strand:+ start:793 stop:1905 length:1113 start_codon:yes stop_codon:yes gene_type:complete